MVISHIYRNEFDGFSEKRLIFEVGHKSPEPAPTPEQGDELSTENINESWEEAQKRGAAELAAYMDNMEAMEEKSGTDKRAEEVIAAAKEGGVDASEAIAGLASPKTPSNTTTKETKDDISLAAKIIEKRESEPEEKSGTDKRAEEVIAAAKEGGVDASELLASIDSPDPGTTPTSEETKDDISLAAKIIEKRESES